MNKIMKRFLLVLLMALPIALVSCGDDDDYYPEHPGWVDDGGNGGGNHFTGPLNQYEKALVGDYISDDKPESPFTLILRQDRTGYCKSVVNGKVELEDGFRWEATANKLTVMYDSDKSIAEMAYSFGNGHLIVDGIPLVINDGNTGGDGGTPGGSDDKPQTPLIGMWQGAINGYYSEVWGLEGDNYMTVCEFMADGNGRQLDYDRFSPRTDFAYTPFTWMQTQDAVTIAYAPDSHLSAVRISDFALTDVEFSGRMAYGDKTFTFAMGRITSFDWSPYTGPHNVSPAGRGLAAKRKTASLIVRQGAFAGR